MSDSEGGRFASGTEDAVRGEGTSAPRPEPWNDNDSMVSAYESQDLDALQMWQVLWYKSSENYEEKLRWYASALAGLPSDSSILDIGCGTGEMLAWCDLPPNYRGVELVPGFVSTARKRFPGRQFDCVDILTSPVHPADTVVMMGILGSSPEPMALVERACLLTRGRLFFDYFAATDNGRLTAGYHHGLRVLSEQAVLDALTATGLTVVGKETVGISTMVAARRRG